jgi:hypothetical protein
MKVSGALESLRYQILRPSVTTMSACVNTQICTNHARGRGECWNCIVDRFEAHEAGDAIQAYALALEAQQRAALAAEVIAEMAMGHDK